MKKLFINFCSTILTFAVFLLPMVGNAVDCGEEPELGPLCYASGDCYDEGDLGKNCYRLGGGLDVQLNCFVTIPCTVE